MCLISTFPDITYIVTVLADNKSFTIPPPTPQEHTMSKEQKSNKMDKKKPLLTPKEKKAAKKTKKEGKGLSVPSKGS
jgi:hypothetical protein